MTMMKPTTSNGACDACGMVDQFIITSPLGNNKALCLKCIHAISVEMGLREAHAITCIKCNSTSGFEIIYERPPIAKLTFKRAEENDEEGVPVYDLICTSGLWNSRRHPSRYKCINCSAPICYFIPRENPYVKKFIPDGSPNVL